MIKKDKTSFAGGMQIINLSFGMAPDGEYLIVQMSVSEMGQESPVQKYLIFQKGFG